MAKPEMRPDISGTINKLQIGESVVFKMKHAKTATVRVAVFRISKRTGKVFTTTDRNMIGEILVIRTK